MKSEPHETRGDSRGSQGTHNLVECCRHHVGKDPEPVRQAAQK